MKLTCGNIRRSVSMINFLKELTVSKEINGQPFEATFKVIQNNTTVC